MSGLFEMDTEVRERRDRYARRAVEEQLPGLLEIAGRTDLDPSAVEDAVCRRIGEVMHRSERPDSDDLADSADPDRVLGALADVVIDALGAPAAVPGPGEFEQGGGLFAAWRLWEVVCEISPIGQARALRRLEKGLRTRMAAPFPEHTERSGPLGSLRWSSDAYGSRFLITAEFERAGRRRWYAWDVDACGVEPTTVAAGFFGGCEAAFEEWRAAVGEVAAGSSVLVPVTSEVHKRLVQDLLPGPEEFGRIGGESVELMAEYHRSRRLADQVTRSASWRGASAVRKDGGFRARQDAKFASWLAERRPDREFADDFQEVVSELAETWAGVADEVLFLTCSPHRVAERVHAVHGFYLPEFAAELLELFPEWVRWIAEQTGLPEPLLERSLASCEGGAHPALESGEREPNWYARCVE
jgi:hypothetical protein